MSFSQRSQLTEPFKIATMHQRGYLLEIAPSFQSWFICFFDDRWRQSTLSYYTIDRNARDYYWSLDLLRRGHSPANQWAALGPFQGLRKLYHYYRGTSVGMQYIDDEQIYKHLAAALARGQMEVHKVYDPHEAYRAFAAAVGPSSTAPEEPASTAKPETLRISETPQLLPLDLQCLLCDGQPAANLPYQVVFADGSQLSGALDATGKAHHDNLKPGAVSVTFGEQSDPSVEKATRDEIAAALSKMIADEQAQTTALAATWDELSGGEKVLVSTGALFTGLWNGATSAAEFVANVHNAGSLHANLMRAFKASWSAHNSQTDGWLTAFKSNWSSSTHQAYVRALGFDPTQISRDDLARAYETASLIYDDAETRALLVQFGKDLAAAQHHTEWTEMGGASLFEVVLTAVLAVGTGGAGAAARMGTNVSHLKKLGGLFEKMATVLRKKKLHRKAEGSAGGKIEAQLDKTEGAEGFEIKASKERSDSATEPSQDDILHENKTGKHWTKSIAPEYKPGFSETKILELPKGERPDPSVYLTDSYRNSHADLFKEGAVRIQPEAPSGTIGRTETWVFPKSLADEAIREANGDIRALEKMLGLDENYLGENPVRVDIENPSGYSIPTGNEFGANSFWRPGGVTWPGGLPEATINPVSPQDYSVKSIF